MAEFWATHSRLHLVVVVLGWIAVLSALRVLWLHDSWVGAVVGTTVIGACLVVTDAMAMHERPPADERPPIGLAWDQRPQAVGDEQAQGRGRRETTWGH